MEEIMKKIMKFRDDREWKQFHTPKNLASAISIEAAELNEIFLWKKDEESFKVNKEKVSDELADVLFVIICLANQTGIDLTDALSKNLDKKTNRDSERHHSNTKLA